MDVLQRGAIDQSTNSSVSPLTAISWDTEVSSHCSASQSRLNNFQSPEGTMEALERRIWRGRRGNGNENGGITRSADAGPGVNTDANWNQILERSQKPLGNSAQANLRGAQNPGVGNPQNPHICQGSHRSGLLLRLRPRPNRDAEILIAAGPDERKVLIRGRFTPR
jgi:hypothetical protein